MITNTKEATDFLKKSRPQVPEREIKFVREGQGRLEPNIILKRWDFIVQGMKVFVYENEKILTW